MKPKQTGISGGLSLLFLAINICLVAVIVTPSGHYNPSNIQGNINTEVLSTPRFSMQPDLKLEWRLVDRAMEADWFVEKYQEYEIHLNREGKMVKEIPTANFNYLKYWRYK
jgi:hypothetical protein